MVDPNSMQVLSCKEIIVAKKKEEKPKKVLPKLEENEKFHMGDEFYLKKVEDVEKDQKKKISTNRLSKLKAFATTVNESVGEGTLNVTRAQSKMIRVSTGILSLDLAIGGGWPIMGKMGLVWGKKSQGKTELCLRTMQSFQNHCAFCAQPLNFCKPLGCGRQEPMLTNLTDIENSWDDSWAISKGIDPGLVTISQPDCLEDTVDIITESINQRLFSLHVLDSMAMVAPEKELEDGQAKWQQGLAARIQNKGWRAWTNALNSSMKAGFPQFLLVVNQEREKIGVMFGDPATKPGGSAQEFMPSIIIRTQAAEYKERENPVTSAKESYAVDLKGFVEKNKTAPAKAGYHFLMYTRDYGKFKKGDLDERAYLLTCIEKCGWLGMIKPKSNKWTINEVLVKELGIEEETKVLDKKGKFSGEITGDSNCKLDKESQKLYFKTKGQLVDSIFNNEVRYAHIRTRIIDAILAGKIELQKVDKSEEEIANDAKIKQLERNS